MSDEIILTPTIKTRKKVDKSMIGLPTDFRHLAHVEEKTENEKIRIKTTDDVIDATNQTHYYQRPISSTTTSVRSILKKDRIGLDDLFPAPVLSKEISNSRGYVNRPSPHTYQNIVVGTRPSTKKYQAPPPPPSSTKPKIIKVEEVEVEEENETKQVIFRQISAPIVPEEAEQPDISTPDIISAPKPNSVIIERPDILMNFNMSLDTPIPVLTQSSMSFPLPPIQETPILCSQSPLDDVIDDCDNNTSYMSTIRSTSAQGKEILDDLDDWLDQLDDFDREKLSTISTDESGYPTMASAHDREFMRFLVDKYSLGVEPETIRVRKGQPVTSSKKTYAPIPSFSSSSSSRTKNSPPNRPPPSYDTPSYEAPNNLLKSKNNFDLRSTISSDTVPPELAQYFEDKQKMRRISMPGTISSDITDFSTTSSRYEQSDDVILSDVSEEEEIEKKVEIVPIPKPRTRKLLSTLKQESIDENCNDRNENENEEIEMKIEKENQNEIEEEREQKEEEEEEDTFVCRF